MILQRIPVLGSILFGSLALVSPALCQTSSAITAGFTGTDIEGDHFIWFNAHIYKVDFAKGSQAPADVVMHVVNQAITFTNNGTDYSISLPDSVINFSPSNSGTETFANGSWIPGSRPRRKSARVLTVKSTGRPSLASFG